jgi:cell division protein FtsN
VGLAAPPRSGRAAGKNRGRKAGTGTRTSHQRPSLLRKACGFPLCPAVLSVLIFNPDSSTQTQASKDFRSRRSASRLMLIGMAFRDGSSVLVSRQSVLLATAVGMGLLTLVYVLGVQVGKQTTAMRAGAKSSPEDLKELPAPLTEQLKAFEVEAAAQEKVRSEPPKLVEKAPEKEPEKPAPKAEAKKPEAPPKAEAKLPATKPGPEPKGEAKAESKPAPGERWTQQLVTTTDAAEAKRIAARAKEAGFETVELKAGNAVKVRVKGAMSRADANAAAEKLKEKGLKPFPVKVE